MDIVNHNHPMLAIDHFEVFTSHNQGMMVLHATGYMMDTSYPAYVTFPKKEIPTKTWVEDLITLTKDVPHITKQLLNKGLGEPIAKQVMAIHKI